MNYQVLAFFMGFFGSLHCVAMCGPLVLALPAAGRSRSSEIFNKVVYQAGRITTYTLLGLIMGLIGSAVSVNGWQQWTSLLMGILLVAAGLINLFGRRAPFLIKTQQLMIAPLIRKMGYWLHRPGGHYMVGLLNGFLPCGMVYMALAAALNADSVLSSGLFMTSFGLGTLPMMLVAVLLGNVAKRYIHVNRFNWLPILFLVLGAWFLLRGANLNIPYISPLIYPEGAMMCQRGR